MDTTVLESATTGGQYLDWGVVQISATNLIVIAVMLIVFALALVVPMARHRANRRGGPR